MTTHAKGFLFLGLLTLAAAGVARAAESASPGKIDREFLIDAASAGMMEVELGRLATTHAASSRVKEFGQRMVDDHGKANAELKQLAMRGSITLPATMKAEHRAMVDRLAKLHGAEFDRAYMKAMREDHEADVAKFRDKARSADDPGVKEFAAKTLPTLEEHLRMAKEVVPGTGRESAGARPHQK